MNRDRSEDNHKDNYRDGNKDNYYKGKHSGDFEDSYRDNYLGGLFVEDPVLEHVRQSIAYHGMPEISVPPILGRLLTMLANCINAKHALEIGSLGGYSAICIARALPDDGQLTCLEHNPEFITVAKANLEAAGLLERVTFLQGEAANNLAQLVKANVQYDVIFIDADKMNYPAYLTYALSLSHPGTLIIADNVLLKNRVCDSLITAPSPVAMRQFNTVLATHPQLESVILPAYDGFAIARVKS
jgi:caffeoyl-CoA O-methyltransferase